MMGAPAQSREEVDMRRLIAAIVGPVAVVLLAAGCETAPKPAAPVEAKPAPDPAPAPAERRKPSVDRTPIRSGDYLVYPLQWKSAGEAAIEVQAILYPK